MKSSGIPRAFLFLILNSFFNFKVFPSLPLTGAWRLRIASLRERNPDTQRSHGMVAKDFFLSNLKTEVKIKKIGVIEFSWGSGEICAKFWGWGILIKFFWGSC